MTDKQINRWLRRRFSAVGWILLLYYGLMTLTTSITAVTDMAAQLLESGGILLDWEKINGNAWGYIAALLVGFAILSSAILFGLFHGNLLQTPYALLMGLVLGYVTVEYSIGWAIALHMFNNLVLADLLTRLTANWSEMAYGTLNLILFGGSAVISVWILLRNRGEIRAYRGSDWIDRRCLKCFFTSGGILALTALACVNMILVLLA